MKMRIDQAECIRRFKAKHKDKYNYSKAVYLNSYAAVIIICPIHGEFELKPKAHWSGSGCPLCRSRQPIDQAECIRRFKAKHNDTYDYSKVIYTKKVYKVCIICPVHGEFNQRADTHWSGHGCPKCANIRMSDSKLLSLPAFLERFKSKHGDKYDYSNILEYNHSFDIINIGCPIHGPFEMSFKSHGQGRECPICTKLKTKKKRLLTLEQCLTKFKAAHADKYNYDLVVYNGTHNYVDIICPIHGKFKQLPYNHYNGHGCPGCKSMPFVSKAENNIAKFISSLGLTIYQSNRYDIYPLELDIVVPSKNIAIEFNGNYWHSDVYKDKNYHLNKTKQCNDKNMQLIHIFEDEWANKQKIVKNRLKSILGQNKYHIYARKCIIKEIDPKSKSKFLNKYHIQGNDNSSIRLGLFYTNKLVAVMTFGKRRFDKKSGYELIRYCTISNFTIIGGAGKLLKYFERNYKPEAVISYADIRWSEGNVYNQLGFDHIRNSQPGYFYVNNQTGYIRESRIKYQKHKLPALFDNYSNDMTEYENMQNNGFFKLYDCGNMVFEKTYI